MLRTVITQMCAENTQRLNKNKFQEKKDNIQAHDDSVLEAINPNFVRSNTMSTINEFINDESNDS
jgi:hypothetical protein